MRLIARTDTPLAAGLVIGALILFHQPLRLVLDWARSIDDYYHLDLVPALIVLAALFTFHQFRKRRRSQAEMMAAAAEARQHLARTRELEALVAFGRTLATALDVQGLGYAVSKCLPGFTRECGTWVLVIRQGAWHTLSIDPVTEQELSRDELERLATSALAIQAVEPDAHAEGIVVESSVCFPLVVGSAVVGVLGVRQPAVGSPAVGLDGAARRALGVAASFLSVAVRNVHLIVETRDVSVHDPLTGCLHRTPGLEALSAELRRAKRSNLPLSVLMLDVDEFKQINDRYGHQCGDLVLGAIGRRLQHTLRGSDVKCRYGGDEFILILPDTPLHGAQQVANGILKEIMAYPVEHSGSTLSATVSIGIACTETGDADAKTVIERADKALYCAKKAGRNRWCVAASDGGVQLDAAASAASRSTTSRANHVAHDIERTA